VNYSKIKRRNGVVKRPLPAPEELPLIINFRLNLSISLDSRIEENSQAEVMFKAKRNSLESSVGIQEFWLLVHSSKEKNSQKSDILKSCFYKYSC